MIRRGLSTTPDLTRFEGERPNSSDILRVGVMNERIGTMALSDPRAAWRTFQDAFLVGHAPAGQDRYRSLLQACINVWQERHDLPRVKIKAIPFDNQRIRFHVFLNRLGQPYTDTRDLAIQGGNPLKRAHTSACERAGIADFTDHDWRHHWASQFGLARCWQSLSSISYRALFRKPG